MRKLWRRLLSGHAPVCLSAGGPVSVEVAGADGLVQQRARLQRGDDAARQRLARTGVPGAKVDHAQTVRFLRVTEDDVAVARPDLVARRVLGILELGREISEVGSLEITAEGPLVDLPLCGPPSEPGRYPLVQLAPGLLRAPDKRTRIEPVGGPPLASPLGESRTILTPAVPLVAGSATTIVSRGESCTSVPSLGSRQVGIALAFSNSALINAVIAGAISRSSSKRCARSLTTFFRVGL